MDDDLLPISALQHYLYCPRQCALIHVEREWAESRHTAEGRLLHERADSPGRETRKGLRTISAMPLADAQLGIAGIADVVEIHSTEIGDRIFPVEYKRGRPKAHRADEVQLCAQALCLESMLGAEVTAGALFYGQTRRRQDVIFDGDLRALTRRVIDEARAMMLSGLTPPAQYESKRCDMCSLIDICQPRWLEKGRGVVEWVRLRLED